MKKIVLMVAAGLIALAGAAMADQAVVVSGTLRTPAPAPADEVSLSQPMEDIPDSPAVGIGEHVDALNGALADNGAPAGLDLQQDRARARLDCDVALTSDGLPCHGEPPLENPAAQYVGVGPDGITPRHNWITLDTGEVFLFAAEKVPPEQRAPLEEANDAVNVAAAAALVDESSLQPNGRPGLVGDDGRLLKIGRLKDLASLPGFAAGLPGDGLEAPWAGEGFEGLFANDAPGLQTTTAEGSNLGPAGDGSGSGSSGGDLAAMAMMAALVGAPLVGGAALYHRIRSNHALNNKTRQAVYDAVVRNPGLGVNDAAKAAGCSYSTAAYHLERLVEERLLVASEDGRRARFFKNGGAFSQQEREFVPILQSKECMDVLTVIVENPWCYRAEVAQKLSVSGPTVNWHLKKLMGAGVVKEMREGRVSYLYADKKALAHIGANLVGKMPEDLVARLRFERKPEAEMVEPAMALPETGVPEVGVGESLELSPLPEANA